MDGYGEIPGSAGLELVAGVRLLHEEDAVFEAMLRGWGHQQRGGRGLSENTIRQRETAVRRFFVHSNEYPWHWTSARLDEWSADLVSVKRLSKSTIRSAQGAIRAFETYILAPQYGWQSECLARFGTHPVQICFEENTSSHLLDYEGQPGRRPLTREELQQFFDYADERVDRALRRGRKGALQAYRDATFFKVVYGWGLRCNEATRLDLTDWYKSPQAPEFGRFGKLEVRWGKATRGSAPRRRTVLSVMPWAVEAVADYLDNVRAKDPEARHPAMWLTERGGRLSNSHIEHRFAEYRKELGLDTDLVPHSLRHSYVTHLIEDGADPTFVQRQVGHRYQSTTAIYSGVSGDFMNTMMRKTMDHALAIEKDIT